MTTTTAPALIPFVKTHATRLSSGGFIIAMLLLLYLGVSPEARGSMFLLVSPLLLGALVPTISAHGLTEWINRAEQIFQSNKAKALEQESKFARFFKRPFWTGSLKLWTATGTLADAHVRAGTRAAAALYFWGMMIFALIIAVYIILAILFLLLMIVIAFKIYEFSQDNTTERSSDAPQRAARAAADRTVSVYDREGNTVGFDRETTDIFGNPKIEHFDKAGNKIGESRPTTGLLGDPKTEHFDHSGSRTGESRPTTGLLGDPKTEHFDRSGSKIGESRPTTDLLGNPKTEHFNRQGDKTGETRE